MFATADDTVTVNLAVWPSATVAGPVSVTKPFTGVPEPCTQALKLLVLVARIRTRYGVPLVKDEIVCDAVVPVRVTATQPADALLPEAASVSATPLASAEV